MQQPCQYRNRRVRALRPFQAEDHRLLEVVNRGEFVINGPRNRDLQRLLYESPPEDRREKRRRSAAVGRRLRLLRAHGILQKVPRTHRCQITQNGRLAIAAILTILQTSMAMLNQIAA